jgi:hypothetical protein
VLFRQSRIRHVDEKIGERDIAHYWHDDDSVGEKASWDEVRTAGPPSFRANNITITGASR